MAKKQDFHFLGDYCKVKSNKNEAFQFFSHWFFSGHFFLSVIMVQLSGLCLHISQAIVFTWQLN